MRSHKAAVVRRRGQPAVTIDRPTCAGCGANAPETNTTYTLISTSFGWRLARRKGPHGSLLVEWRCPVCWKRLKAARDPGNKTAGAAVLRRSVQPDPFRR